MVERSLLQMPPVQRGLRLPVLLGALAALAALVALAQSADAMAVLNVLDGEVVEGDPGDAMFVNMTVMRDVTVGSPQFSYTIIENDAIADEDYVNITGTATFPPGSLYSTIQVPVIEDDIDEQDHTFVFVIDNPIDATIDDAWAVGTILDDDQDGFAIEAYAEGYEEGPMPMQLRIFREPDEATVEVDVEYWYLSGTAQWGIDYDGTGVADVYGGWVTFQVGVSEIIVDIDVIDDGEDELTENAIFGLSGCGPTGQGMSPPNSWGVPNFPGGFTCDHEDPSTWPPQYAYRVSWQVYAAVLLIDNDDPTITVAAIDPEGHEVGPDQAVFRISRNGDASINKYIVYNITGTATNGVDYAALPYSSWIMAGEMYVDLVVDVTPDLLPEPTETVTIQIQPDLAYEEYLVGDPNEATAVIKNMMPALSIEVIDGEAVETDATDTALLRVTRAGYEESPPAITVHYNVTGTATPGFDYATLSGILEFDASQMVAEIEVSALPDDGGEGPETVIVALQPLNGHMFLEDVGTATIIDDYDEDGLPDNDDNCVLNANPPQADGDGDNIGDACDDDWDNDGVPNNTDNCILQANGNQTDTDYDGQGDVCDDWSPPGDADGDGVVDIEDNCPGQANGDQADADGDGIGDVCDASTSPDEGAVPTEAPVPSAYLPVDEGDAAPIEHSDEIIDEPDTDLDGVPDRADNCPDIANPAQADGDGDQIGDVCDLDHDNDGMPTWRDDGSVWDNCPFTPNPAQVDVDRDGVGDRCQGDRDADGVPDVVDNCVWVQNPMQEDANQDGTGDHCEGMAIEAGLMGGPNDGHPGAAEGARPPDLTITASAPQPGGWWWIVGAVAGAALVGGVLWRSSPFRDRK